MEISEYTICEKDAVRVTIETDRLLITPADEKTHGFIRVDDSPQIFYYL